MAWYKESGRHSKAARGIETGRKDRSHPKLSFKSRASPASSVEKRELNRLKQLVMDVDWNSDDTLYLEASDGRSIYRFLSKIPLSSVSGKDRKALVGLKTEISSVDWNSSETLYLRASDGRDLHKFLSMSEAPAILA